MKEAPKYKAIRDSLLQSIHRGVYAPGQRLPAEKEIASQFGVSHMTARHAVTELVESGTLERKVGSGAYVRSHGADPSTDFTVHVLCPAVENSQSRNFLRVAAQEIAARGWKFRAVQVQSGTERHAVRVIEQGGYALVMLEEALLNTYLLRSLKNAAGRAVLMGSHSSDSGVPSVLSDDELAMRMTMNHLQSQGHSRIGILTAHPEESMDKLQIAEWRQELNLSAEEATRWLLVARSCDGKSEIQDAYDVVRDHLMSDHPVTALICLNDELALAANSACSDSGYAVPAQMSIIASGDSPLMEFVRPAITCIDVNLRKHIQTGLEILEKRSKGFLETSELNGVIEPRLVIRQSVAAI